MLRNLEPRMENQRKKETGEMMGKLKELGNTFLGSLHTKNRIGMRSDETPQVTLVSPQTISNSSRTDKGGIPSTSRGDRCSLAFLRSPVGTPP